jgi:bacillithiol system protein YtxJ
MGESPLREIVSDEGWEALLGESEEVPVLVLKHSTACPVSGAAHGRVVDYMEGRTDIPEIVMVKVIESRPVSLMIAEVLGITHKSPQMILIKNRQGLWSASHHGINASAIDGALADHVE